MIVYVIATIISMVLSAFAFHKKDPFAIKTKYEKFAVFLSVIPLTLVAGLRYGVGQDYFFTYQPYFDGLLYGKVNSNIEIGFYSLTKIIQLFTDDYAWLFIVCAIFFSYFTFKAIYLESTNPIMSIFLLVAMQYYFIFMNGMRQMMAISIFLTSIKYIRERKFIPYLILILLATSFHSIGIIFLPLYFLYRIKMTPKKCAIGVTISVIGSTIISTILMKILKNTKYIFYIGSVYDVESKGYIIMLIEIAILILACLFYKNTDCYEEEQKKYNFYVLLKFIATIIACLNSILPLLFRVRWCFGFSSIILIPLALSRIKCKKNKLILSIIIYSLFIVYIFYTVGIQNANNVLPYRSIIWR